MRIVFMGTPDFAQVILQSLVEAGHEVLAVYTQPDRPKGRSGALAMPPVKEYALTQDIPVYQPIRIRREKWVNQLKELAPDLIVVAAFGQILTPAILQIAPCLNVHASLLPKYRGSAPIAKVIADGEKETGVTIMHMDEGIDTGNMVHKVVVPIESTDNAQTLHDKLAEAGALALQTVLEGYADGTNDLVGEKQDENLATYVPMMSKEDGKIDWNSSAFLIDCHIRAFTPWPSSWTMLDGKQIKILKAHPLAAAVSEVQSGTVLTLQQCESIGAGKNDLLIQTGNGILAVDELQLAGKKPTEAAAFLRGRDIRGKEFDR